MTDRKWCEDHIKHARIINNHRQSSTSSMTDACFSCNLLPDIFRLGLLENHLPLAGLDALSKSSNGLWRSAKDFRTNLLKCFFLSSKHLDLSWGSVIDLYANSGIPKSPLDWANSDDAFILFPWREEHKNYLDLAEFKVKFQTATRGVFVPLWNAKLPVIAAGGLVERLFVGKQKWDDIPFHQRGDIDIFIYGENQDDVKNRILDIWTKSGICKYSIDHEIDNSSQYHGFGLTKGILKFRDATTNSQVISRFDIIRSHKKNALAVLADFDLNCVKLAYDGRSLFSTFTGIESISTKLVRMNEADLRRLFQPESNLWYRVVKYACRGWSFRFVGIPNAAIINRYLNSNQYYRDCPSDWFRTSHRNRRNLEGLVDLSIYFVQKKYVANSVALLNDFELVPKSFRFRRNLLDEALFNYDFQTDESDQESDD